MDWIDWQAYGIFRELIIPDRQRAPAEEVAAALRFNNKTKQGAKGLSASGRDSVNE